MRAIHHILWGLILGLTALWLLIDPLPDPGQGFFPWRGAWVDWTGVLAMGMMSLGMILAARPAFIEPLIGGLDKGYRLHKWLGIGGLILAILHWLGAQGTKWLVGWGLLERPVRPPAVELDAPILALLRAQRHLAETIGEWAFYLLAVLLILALLRRLPYRRVFQVHRLLAILYLLLVFHAVVLMPFAAWGHGLGPVMALLMTAGSLAAIRSILGLTGRGRRVAGRIETLTHHADADVLELEIRAAEAWPGHRAGQFAFVTFDRREGAHPFTIASAWQDDGRLRFLIKALGDHTSRLPETLKVGDPVQVEGPYGRFDFTSATPRQIWVAGGIGVTPFLARLQALAGQPSGGAIDLFVSTRHADAGLVERLRESARAAGVRLHLVRTRHEGRLSAEQIRARVPQWREADVWYCGPVGLGQSLRRAMVAAGLRAEAFHQELFEMR